MKPQRPTDLTKLLEDANAGRAGAVDALAEAIHDELRGMAQRHLAKDFGRGMAGVTIQPTVLANDTLMKLIRQRTKFDNAGHLFAIASRLMMRILIDYHRSRKARKRGGGQIVQVSLDPDAPLADPGAESRADDAPDIEALNDALDKLAELDARKSDVVKYRILWGLTVPQVAETLGIGVATVERDWAFAKAWLKKMLKENAELGTRNAE